MARLKANVPLAARPDVALRGLHCGARAGGLARPRTRLLLLEIQDVDTVAELAVAAGAQIEMAVAETFWGSATASSVTRSGIAGRCATRCEDLTLHEIAHRLAGDLPTSES